MMVLRSFSTRRFRITGSLPPLDGDEFSRRLADRRFLPLTAHETATHGWVSADNLLKTDLDRQAVRRGDHAVFALRIDRRRVDPRLLRARLDLELEARRKAVADGARKVSRDERRQLKKDIEEELLAQTNPSIGICTVIVEPRRKVLYALTRSRPVIEILTKLISDTFGVELTPLTPWARSREVLAGTAAAPALEGLEPTGFAVAVAEPLPRHLVASLLPDAELPPSELPPEDGDPVRARHVASASPLPELDR